MAKKRKKLTRRVRTILIIVASVVAIAGTSLMVASLMTLIPATSTLWSFFLGLGLVLVAGYLVSRWS